MCANKFLEVLAPNIVLCCDLGILVKVSTGLKARKCEAVDICRLCGGVLKARRAIGFAAANMPFGIIAIVLCILEGTWGTRLGLRIEGKEEGRSRTKSGATSVGGYGRS